MKLMETKGFTRSKLNLVGILTAVAGLAGLAQMLPEEYGKYVLVASGVAVVILRTFYTNAPIEVGKR